MTVISGTSEPGYGRVAEAFARVVEPTLGGAAVAVYRDGRPVVDLWGGNADPVTGKPWVEDTTAVVFSCSKGLLTIATYLEVGHGWLDLDEPVVSSWPEYAAGGKAHTTIRMLLAHQAGLPELDAGITVGQIAEWTPVIESLQAQHPRWQPGTAHSYHSLSFGWLVGEILRRVTGTMPGDYISDRITGPLGADIVLGSPREQHHRVALPNLPAIPGVRPAAGTDPAPDTRIGDIVSSPDHLGEFFSAALCATQIPAGNMVGTARALARVYAATVGEVDGVRLLDDNLLDDATQVQSEGATFDGDLQSHRWGTGFMLDSPPARDMLGPRSFGHDGAGGQHAFADRDAGIGFGFVTNDLRAENDSRANDLVAALRDCR